MVCMRACAPTFEYFTTGQLILEHTICQSPFVPLGCKSLARLLRDCLGLLCISLLIYSSYQAFQAMLFTLFSMIQVPPPVNANKNMRMPSISPSNVPRVKPSPSAAQRNQLVKLPQLMQWQSFATGLLHLRRTAVV